jgi:hypothetical protein
MDQGVKGMDFKNENRPKHFNKAMSRMTGIKKAADKLAKEEVELDEVSQETLRNYHAKAALDLRKKREKLDKGTLTSKDYKQGQNRVTGLNRAANKMEEVELDELKKSTLGSYVKRAAGSMAGKTAVAAAQASSSMGKASPDIKRGIVNRMKGITRATDKLTKEEVELDEASNIGDAYMKHLHTKYNDKKSLSKSETEEVKDMMTRHTIADVKKLAGSGIRHVSDAAKNHVKRYVPGSMKKEETEIEEKKLTPKQIKAALGAVKAKPKDQVSVAKAPWDMKKEDAQRWRVYNKILEADAHTKGATPPEAIDSKASQGEKDFVKLHGGLNGNDSGIDGAKAAADTAKNAAAGVKVAPKRPSDNPAGDKSVIKSTEAK